MNEGEGEGEGDDTIGVRIFFEMLRKQSYNIK